MFNGGLWIRSMRLLRNIWGIGNNYLVFTHFFNTLIRSAMNVCFFEMVRRTCRVICSKRDKKEGKVASTGDEVSIEIPTRDDNTPGLCREDNEKMAKV